jgi:hypothetical protein
MQTCVRLRAIGLPLSRLRCVTLSHRIADRNGKEDKDAGGADLIKNYL